MFKRSLLYGGVALFGLLILSAYFAEKPGKKPAGPYPSLSVFKRLRTGMSLEDAERIVGRPAVGVRGNRYFNGSWQMEDGYTISIEAHDYVVITDVRLRPPPPPPAPPHQKFIESLRCLLDW